MTEVSGNSLDMMVVMNQSLMQNPWIGVVLPRELKQTYYNVARLHVRLGKERLRLSLPMRYHERTKPRGCDGHGARSAVADKYGSCVGP
jgi:hypothetical protein